MLNQNDAHHEGGAATHTGVRPPEFVCAGDDLKDMLAELTRQFVAADQRNTAALQDMRGRLQTLGRDAETVRDQVPPQFAPAFARIEDGVQMLAERIASVGREREIAKATASLAEAMARPQPDLWPMSPVPQTATVSAHAEPVDTYSELAPAAAAAFVPAPLVAVSPAATTPAAPAAAIIAQPAVVTASLPGDAAAPWDADAAAALVDLYESGEGHVGDRAPAAALAPTAKPIAPVEQLVAMAAAPSAFVANAPLADQSWLDERFAAVTARIEQSIASLRPDSALATLDGRLEQLEHRFGNAMQDVATRADVDGLRIVEAHLNELFTQFERAQAQLGRLDGIELQLGDLMHQVSDERFGNLFAQHLGAGHQGPTEEDIEAVAMAVADRVASRLPAPESASAAFDHAPITDLKRIVEGFVASQRETEEHTSTMLDTMQQAMIRMLDRMDAIENSAPSYSAPAASFVPAPVATAPAPAAVAPTLRVEPRMAPEVAPSSATHEPTTMLPNRAQPQSKEDFRAAAVADARRAARKVAAQVTDTGAAEAVATAAVGARARRGMPPLDMGEQAEAAHAATDGKSRSRTPMMVAGIALLVAVGFLAASVGFNRGGPLIGGVRQTAEQKAPLVIDNGSVETTAGDIAAGSKETPPTAPGKTPARPSTAAAPQPAGQAGGSIEGLSDQAEVTSGQGTMRQEAAIQTPTTAAAAQALGITVTPTSTSVPVNSDLARMRRERNMASLASQLAQVQANAPTVPASLLPNGVSKISAEVVGGEAVEAAMPSELPPAQIGPMSLRVAAQKGDPSAEFEVAARFAEGRGITQDFKQALNWYQRSAQRGFAPAQYRLATLFERGIGAKADLPRAKIWYGRAAEQGHIKAMHNLAVLNAGRDGSGDYATAVQWFTAAADRGLADSQFNLGVLYESGLGMQRDLKQAYHWLSLAARGGDKEAGRRRDAIRMKLEESDVAAADAAVEAWRAQSADPTVNEARAAGEVWKQRQASAN